MSYINHSYIIIWKELGCCPLPKNPSPFSAFGPEFRPSGRTSEVPQRQSMATSLQPTKAVLSERNADSTCETDHQCRCFSVVCRCVVSWGCQYLVSAVDWRRLYRVDLSAGSQYWTHLLARRALRLAAPQHLASGNTRTAMKSATRHRWRRCGDRQAWPARSWEFRHDRQRHWGRYVAEWNKIRSHRTLPPSTRHRPWCGCCWWWLTEAHYSITRQHKTVDSDLCWEERSICSQLLFQNSLKSSIDREFNVK